MWAICFPDRDPLSYLSELRQIAANLRLQGQRQWHACRLESAGRVEAIVRDVAGKFVTVSGRQRIERDSPAMA